MSNFRRAKRRPHRTKIDGYDFSRKWAITETSQKIILGFDPSTSFAGVSLYDAKADKVLEYDGIDPVRLRDWLMDMLRVYASERGRIIARLELPVKATAYGIAKSMTATSKTKKTMTDAWNVVWGSARCFEQARQFMEIVSGVLPFELIASEHRINSKTNKRLAGLPPEEIEKWARAYFTTFRDPWIFPTKLSAVAVKHFWPEIDVVGDDDLRDALCCSFPEKVFNLMS